MYSSYAPARSILWQIYWRNRWGFAAAGAYLLLAIATSHLLTPYVRTHWGEAGVAMVGLYLGAPCALIIVLVIAAFCLTGSHGFEGVPPSHMLVLPISTRTLVSVPMISGAVMIAVVWLIIALLVLRPADIAAPLLWPAAVLILFLTVFQALAWTPFAQKWLQGVLTIFAGAGTFGWVLGGIAFGFVRFGSTSEPFVAAASIAALVPVAYFVALSGVAMTRRGDCYDWRQWSRLMDRIAAWRKPAEHPFASASAAQIWFECRSCGWYAPLLTAGMAVFFSFMLLSDPSDVTQSWKFLGIFICLPIFLTTMAGGALGNLDGLSPQKPSGSFLFTRPMASAQLVRDKLLMGALSTLAVWLVALPVGALFLFRPGFPQAIVEAARTLPAWKLALLGPLSILLLYATSWKQLVESYWVSLTGRAWLTNIFAGLLIVLIMGGFGFGIWINIFPAYQPAALAAAQWIVDVLLVVKLLVAVLVLRALVSSGMMPGESVVVMVAVWMLVVTLLGSIALWLVPSGAASMLDILGRIILMVPFSRLAGAPLAVEWNRHR